MSGGPRRPPVPGLIPLAALSRRSSIDAGRSKSRGIETTRATAPGGRQRPHHRRRKSVAAAVSKQSRSASPALDRPPRVNPIFVWVRQEDTHIVEVKCEDYDKRNRILLTKTAHGWRAIPRTEMLGAPRASAEPSSSTPPQRNHHHRHHHHHRRRARKSKTHQQSASVQFPPDDQHDSTSEPSWVTSENVNIESLLPSHTIHVTKRTESPSNPPSDETPQDASSSPSDKTCDVSPLENLLAVAELELKQHIQSEKWQESAAAASQKQLEETNSQLDSNEPSDNNPSIEEIDELIKTKAHEMQIGITDDDRKSPECSYNDDDEMSMNDILSRLEQSLQSPHGFGSDNTFEDEILDQDTSDKVFDNNDKPISDDFDGTSKTPTSYETTAADNYVENPIMDYSSRDCYIQESLGDENKVVDNVKAENDEEGISLHNEETDSIQGLVSEEHKSEKNESEEIYEPKESQEVTKDDINTECDNTNDKNENISRFSEQVVNSSSENPQTTLEVPDILETNEEKESLSLSPQPKEHLDTESPATDLENKIVEAESSTVQEDQTKLPEDKTEVGPDVLDLSVKKNDDLEIKIDTAPEPVTVECDEGPTDLSIRKPVLTFNFESPSPASQSSEVSQSPQPSGIPAVPPSPDLVTTSTTTSKPRSVFLESLLANSMNKSARKANTTITKQKEPLDLGKSRKSASPTVTCSEEIVHSSEFEPPAKRLKPDEITLKNLLEKDSDPVDNCQVKSTSEPPMVPESTRPTISASNQKSHPQNPLAEFRQLLEEIDIPNPLMVPKDIFPDLLKHPKQEILKILSGQSKKNVTLDDILVVYKDKLLAAIETSQSHSASVSSNESLKAPIEKPSGNSEKPVQVTTKRKSTDNTTSKGPNISPDSKSSLANDIDAANEAALFWAGCPNPFEAMANYANQTDLIQALYNASTFPYFPGQLGELHPGLQMMLGAKMAPPLSFPPPPPINMNNPFEMSMWQEAMMQASLLQNKNPYENSILNQPNYKSNIEPKSKNHMQQSYANRVSSRHGTNGHGKNMHQNQQQQFLAASSYSQNMAGGDPSWQNPYLGLAGFQQGSNNLTLNIPQFNPFGFKNNPTSPTSKHGQLTSPSHLHKQNREAKMINKMNSESEKKLHSQEQHKLQQQKMLRQQQHQYQLHQQMQHQQMQHQQSMRQAAAASQKQQSQSGLAKKNCIPSFSSLKECIQEKSLMDAHKPGIRQGPIDLSGAQKKSAGCSGSGRSTVTSSKGGDDVPEVGSTTGSIEDMQDQHTQLWHPLFGSHNKGYNPWSLPSLTAMGE